MNQGKLKVVKQEMATVNTDISVKWTKSTGKGEFNSDDHYIYYCGKESLRRNEIALKVNKRVQNTVFGCNLKNNRMISVHFQGKPFNITVIHTYDPTSNTEEAEVEQFYEDLQDLLELTHKKGRFHHSGLECKSRKSRDIWSNRQIWPWVQKEAGQKLTECCQENALVIANTLVLQPKRRRYTWISPDGQYWNQID